MPTDSNVLITSELLRTGVVGVEGILVDRSVSGEQID